MFYAITHTTTYCYGAAVTLQPHTIRLRPRSDGWQTLQNFALSVTPTPIEGSEITDLEGNNLIKLWFPPEPTPSLEIRVQSQVETHQSNPFIYLLEPWAVHLPIDYPTSLLTQLQPYLRSSEALDPVAVTLAQEIWDGVQGNGTAFLNELNQRIYLTCEYLIRETGDPLPPGLTWKRQQGSCRDVTVLFMEVCRAAGLAARFVSGYQEGDPDTSDRHLHAWVEVYLPGAGWRGYDPTHGLAVSDRHIALVASAFPRYASPISGAFNPAGVTTEMKYQIDIRGQA